ncbi:hypothetical protein M3Y94_00312600 [Aphelenchoides besseyi]|nr:hypothetical protein M3Y94_00312600 [Aphelenchoides besseyi]
MENEGAWWSSEASTSNNTDQLPRETERTVKKPRILRSSSSTPATRSEVDDEVDDIMSSALKKPQPGKMVRLNATTAPTPTVSGSHTPNPNAQPAKSILSNPATRTNRLTKKTSFANSQRQFGLSTNPMNRLNSAKKIRLLNRKNRRFFGLLRGWHKLYSRIFRRARQSPVVVSSFIKNSTLENQKGSLLSMQGERASDVDSRLLFNSFSADFSNNPQRPTNLLGFSSVNHHFNNSIPRPSLGKALDNQMLMDGRRDDMQAIDQRVHGNQHLMDLNASDLAARRMERNLGTSSRPLGIETEMSMDIDGFEDEDESSADEETDPPPPPKENQQRFSRASIRRMRENAAREKRQLENNKKIAERKKEMEQQEQEFAQRHQIAARQPRPIHPKAPMKDLSRMASFESKSTLDGAEDFKSLHELPKLSRHGSDLKSNEITKTAERRVGRAPTASKEDYIRDMNAFSRNRSTSSSSSSSNSSSCSSSSTTPIFDKNDDSRTSESNSKRPRKSQRSTGVAMNLNGDSNSSNADSEKRRKSSTTQNSLTDTNANQMFQRNFSATRKSSIYKSKSDSSESSSSDDDEDSSSTSSSTSPPPLPARLSRQESIGVEIQQDEESRLSGKSTSSIPPPPVLAPHEPIRGSADVGMPLFDHTGSRKSSTSTQSDTANARSFAYGTQKIGQKDARNTDIFGKSDKEKSGTKTKTTTKGSDLLVRKEKKDKSKERSRLTDDDEKSKEKTTEKNKDPERLKEKLRSKDKGRELTETEKSNLKKDKPKEKSKEKPKDKSLKSRESPQPRAATSSTELNDATAERKSKRKRELSEMSPSLVGKPKLSGSKEFEKATQPPKIQKSLSKERERVKEPGMSRAKDAKPLKIKTVKDVKLFTKEISPPPLQQQSRKRSPSGRKKGERRNDVVCKETTDFRS